MSTMDGVQGPSTTPTDHQRKSLSLGSILESPRFHDVEALRQMTTQRSEEYEGTDKMRDQVGESDFEVTLKRTVQRYVAICCH
jgi:hypothetical protein